jgi:hypothetical protein
MRRTTRITGFLSGDPKQSKARANKNQQMPNLKQGHF